MSPDTRKFIETWTGGLIGLAAVLGFAALLMFMVRDTNKEIRCRNGMARAMTAHDTTLVMIAGDCQVEAR